MLYMLTKTGHLIALFLWIGGTLSVVLALINPIPSYLKQLKAYDRVVTSPAMILAWIFGISLGVQGGWFSQPWLGVKIILVLILSGLHGMLAGKLRRAVIAADNDNTEPIPPLILPIGLVLMVFIVLLVVLKP